MLVEPARQLLAGLLHLRPETPNLLGLGANTHLAHALDTKAARAHARELLLLRLPHLEALDLPLRFPLEAPRPLRLEDDLDSPHLQLVLRLLQLSLEVLRALDVGIRQRPQRRCLSPQFRHGGLQPLSLLELPVQPLLVHQRLPSLVQQASALSSLLRLLLLAKPRLVRLSGLPQRLLPTAQAIPGLLEEWLRLRRGGLMQSHFLAECDQLPLLAVQMRPLLALALHVLVPKRDLLLQLRLHLDARLKRREFRLVVRPLPREVSQGAPRLLHVPGMLRTRLLLSTESLHLFLDGRHERRLPHQLAARRRLALLHREELEIGGLHPLQHLLLLLAHRRDPHGLHEPRLQGHIQVRQHMALGGLIQPEQSGQPPVAQLLRTGLRFSGAQEPSHHFIRPLRVRHSLEPRPRPLVQQARGVVQERLLQAIALPPRLQLHRHPGRQCRPPRTQALYLPVLGRVPVEQRPREGQHEARLSRLVRRMDDMDAHAQSLQLHGIAEATEVLNSKSAQNHRHASNTSSDKRRRAASRPASDASASPGGEGPDNSFRSEATRGLEAATSASTPSTSALAMSCRSRTTCRAPLPSSPSSSRSSTGVAASEDVPVVRSRSSVLPGCTVSRTSPRTRSASRSASWPRSSSTVRHCNTPVETGVSRGGAPRDASSTSSACPEPSSPNFVASCAPA